MGENRGYMLPSKNVDSSLAGGGAVRVIDLFSGLGGFSQAFVDRGHDVIRVDNDEQFRDIPHTRIADIMTLEPDSLKGVQNPDIILMSPPCNCFSTLALSTFWENNKPADPRTHEAIALVRRALWLKDELNPRYWVLENPTGMLKYVLGIPAVMTWWAAWGSRFYKATHLWGIFPNVPWPSAPKEGTYIPAPRGSKTGIQGTELSSAERALVPYKFSLALCLAIEKESVEGQTPLTEFIE